MNQLPVTFWPQLFARFGKDSPKFYQLIIKNGLLFTALAVLFPFVVTDLLPGIGIAVPAWLTYANTKVVAICTFLAGLGVGGAVVGGTTIQTRETPPLVTDAAALENPDLAAKVAYLEGQVAELLTRLSPNEP